MNEWKPTPPCEACAHISSLIDSTEYQLEIAHNTLRTVKSLMQGCIDSKAEYHAATFAECVIKFIDKEMRKAGADEFFRGDL